MDHSLAFQQLQEVGRVAKEGYDGFSDGEETRK